MKHSRKEMAEHAQKMHTRVAELFRELFPDTALVKLHVKPDKDWEDEDILDVTVVFDGTEPLDAGKMNKLSSRAWESADGEYDEQDPHPVFHFTNVPGAKELGLVS